jgi:hypothetical protein
MKTGRKIFALSALVLMAAATAPAQDGRVQLRASLKPGQEDRYAITATVDTNVSGTLSSVIYREVTATVVLRTTGVSTATGEAREGGVNREAVIEAISYRSNLNGAETPFNASDVVGQKIDFMVDSAGNLLKCVIPKPVADSGLADLVFSLARWLPPVEVAVGERWEAPGQGPVYSDKMSDISKGSTTVYHVAKLGETAIIDGAIKLKQSGASMLSTAGDRLSINVLAEGSGTTHIEYDVAGGRIISGTSETRLEGRLAHVAQAADGKWLPREGSLVETARYSIKLVR